MFVLNLNFLIYCAYAEKMLTKSMGLYHNLCNDGHDMCHIKCGIII